MVLGSKGTYYLNILFVWCISFRRINQHEMYVSMSLNDTHNRVFQSCISRHFIFGYVLVQSTWDTFSFTPFEKCSCMIGYVCISWRCSYISSQSKVGMNASSNWYLYTWPRPAWHMVNLQHLTPAKWIQFGRWVDDSKILIGFTFDVNSDIIHRSRSGKSLNNYIDILHEMYIYILDVYIYIIIIYT